MATSLLMAATADTNPQDHHHHHDGSHPIRRSSGRRKIKGCDSSSSSSGQKKNKQPQRGMGVEKLERLRLQERWKKMTEINTNISPGAADPIPKMGGFGAPSVGLSHNPSCAYLGFQYGQVDLFGLSKSHVSGNLSKELSSNTNVVKCYPGHCNACHKKKKFNGGDCGFLGLNNIGEYQNFSSQENHQGLNVGTKMPLVPAVGNIGKQGHVEIVAVHRKGCSSSAEGGVMMEYEFFPSCKSDSQINNDELVMMNLIGNSETSSMPGFDGHASNCVDLSLKLSY